MVIGITTTYAISAHHHKCCMLESRPSEMHSIPHYVMKFVSDLRQVANFLRVLRFPPPITLTSTIAEILLKVVLNTINLTLNTELISLKNFKIVSFGTKAM